MDQVGLGNLASLSVGAVVTPTGTLSFAVFAELGGVTYTWPMGPALSIPGISVLARLAEGWVGMAEGVIPGRLSDLGYRFDAKRRLYVPN